MGFVCELPNMSGRNERIYHQNGIVAPLWRRSLLITIAACGWLAGYAACASAEGFFDLYGGLSFSEKTSAVAQDFFPSTSPQRPSANLTKQLDFGTTGTFGVRGGYWIAPLPWVGMAVDLSFFQRKAEGARIDLVPLSFLVMLRYPILTSDEFPKGRLQPYVGIGPSFFYSHASMDFDSPLGHVTHGNLFSDIGLDVRAGASWQASSHIAVFVEYRFTHVNLDYKEEQCLGLSCLGSNPVTVTEHTIETTLDTHHILMGIRF
jgi:hypothetical protein